MDCKVCKEGKLELIILPQTGEVVGLECPECGALWPLPQPLPLEFLWGKWLEKEVREVLALAS